MKPSHLISAILFLFVVYATRVDLALNFMFSENMTTEFIEIEPAENDADEKEKEESKDDDSKEYSFLQNKLNLSYSQLKFKVVAIRYKLASSAIDLEFPPPKV